MHSHLKFLIIDIKTYIVKFQKTVFKMLV